MSIISGNNNNYISTGNNSSILISLSTSQSTTSLTANADNNVTFTNNFGQYIVITAYQNANIVYRASIDIGNSTSTTLAGSYYFEVDLGYPYNPCYNSYTAIFKDDSNGINMSTTYSLVNNKYNVDSYATIVFNGNTTYNISFRRTYLIRINIINIEFLCKNSIFIRIQFIIKIIAIKIYFYLLLSRDIINLVFLSK